MYLKYLKQNPQNLSILRTAIDNLKSINFFAVMYELAASKLATKTEPNLTHYALKASFNDGYLEAMQDLEAFFEIYVKEVIQRDQLKADFGSNKLKAELEKELNNP